MRIKAKTTLRGIELSVECNPSDMNKAVQALKKKAKEMHDDVDSLSFVGLGLLLTQDMAPVYLGSDGRPVDYRQKVTRKTGKR